LAKLKAQELVQFVNNEIVEFHNKKLNRIKLVKLRQVLRKKNPYLFRAKNILVASDLVQDILEAYLYASEEEFFGKLLEHVAIFIAKKVNNGRKSTATGIDLEFDKDNVTYLVSVKSGPNWGNASQHKKQIQDFNTAIKVLKQSDKSIKVQTVLGICYGKIKDTHEHGHLRTMGQNFWYLLSGNKNLYTDIIEPLGHEAKKHNDDFKSQKAQVINLFTDEFMKSFCDNGAINWKKLVEFNSGNFSD